MDPIKRKLAASVGSTEFKVYGYKIYFFAVIALLRILTSSFDFFYFIIFSLDALYDVFL